MNYSITDKHNRLSCTVVCTTLTPTIILRWPINANKIIINKLLKTLMARAKGKAKKKKAKAKKTRIRRGEKAKEAKRDTHHRLRRLLLQDPDPLHKTSRREVSLKGVILGMGLPGTPGGEEEAAVCTWTRERGRWLLAGRFFAR